MAIYLSPGIFSRETDLSQLIASGVGPLRPAFIGTAKKGPLNAAILCTTAQQAIDTFGEPFPESYLMYAALAYFEEGNACYIMRVGIECEDGQVAALSDVCIDTSGGHASGWGRIPLFTGIDYGKINLREISADAPLAFHAASVSSVTYSDVDSSSTHGATTATLQVTGTYTGDVDDSFIMIITAAPDVSSGAATAGADFQIVRNSDGEIVASGTLTDTLDNGQSQVIAIGTGLSVKVAVTAGVLDENDTFFFTAVPENRVFSVSVEGGTAHSYTFPSATYTSVASFVTALNALLSGETYLAVSNTLSDGTIVPQLRTTVAGNRIQIMATQGWALAVGQQQYAWDIPRSYLFGTDAGPYDITSQNNRIALNVIGTTETITIDFNIPLGLAQSTTSVAASVDLAGTVAGTTYFDAFSLTIPGGATHLVIVSTVTFEFSTLALLANFSHLKTLRFAEQVGVSFPYKRAYRGFTDARVILPDSGESDPAIPLSCETTPLGADCASDTAYFANIVGWLVAPSAGTWLNDYTASLEIFTGGVGDSAGRYKLIIKDPSGVAVDSVDDISFDKTVKRYIGNCVNPGSTLGGTNGNSFVNWEERPAFLDNNSNLTSYVVRKPSQFANMTFDGMANGIPLDPVYSSELDAAVIGNPAKSTGIYAFQNPEAIDINLMAIPGFSSGAVIATALQMCEGRGDCLFLVDPPFGLRPQQVVDWHNGMLLSDLTSAINSSYGALYWGWLQVFDQFSASNIWIPPSGHVSAVFSRTARDAEQWMAPAGLRRGRLLTALNVEYTSSQGERDLLYGSGNAVNPIVKFPQEGLTVWGQRTLQRSDTALDRVGVRMLLNFVKKNLTGLLRNFIFEPHDKFLWNQVTNSVDPFLGDIQTRRGLTGYKVVCDATNNTPERIDRNELWVSIFLQPTRTVEFVVLNLVLLRTSGSFSSEEALAAAGIVGANA